jgi:hypothetical protein
MKGLAQIYVLFNLHSALPYCGSSAGGHITSAGTEITLCAATHKVIVVTLHASVRALSPLMAATSSIRLFVVCGSTPRRMRSCFPYRRMHAHPPGPGLPKHDPSGTVTWCTTSVCY